MADATVSVCVTLPRPAVRALDSLARADGRSRSNAVAHAVQLYLRRLQQPQRQTSAEGRADRSLTT